MTNRLKDPSARTDDVSTTKVLGRCREHGFELLPIRDICFLEDGTSGSTGGARVGVDEFLGFGPEGQVGEDDIALLAEEDTGKCEVYSYEYVSAFLEYLQRSGHSYT